MSAVFVLNLDKMLYWVLDLAIALTGDYCIEDLLGMKVERDIVIVTKLVDPYAVVAPDMRFALYCSLLVVGCYLQDHILRDCIRFLAVYQQYFVLEGLE